jgi:hypothetical protein
MDTGVISGIPPPVVKIKKWYSVFRVPFIINAIVVDT